MKRDFMSLPLDLGSELIIDNFAGGGGASTGIEMAFGRPVDVAINHDGEALAMHAANHPTTKHYQEDVFAVHPGFVTNQQPIGLAWFSPDCKHHSKAKGGKPRGGLDTYCVLGLEIKTPFGICIGGHECKGAHPCEKWERRTREMGEARADRSEKAITQMMLVGPAVAEWRNKKPIGKAEIIECPACKGRLHLSQAASNGHVHGKCETADCVSWME
jgi:hypothetical protein